MGSLNNIPGNIEVYTKEEVESQGFLKCDIDFTNGDNDDMDIGDVVVIDDTSNDSVKKCTIAKDSKVVGVIKAGGGPGAQVKVCVSGMKKTVKVKEAISSGDIIETSETLGQAQKAITQDSKLGKAITNSAGPGIIKVLINI